VNNELTKQDLAKALGVFEQMVEGKQVVALQNFAATITAQLADRVSRLELRVAEIEKSLGRR